MKRKPSSGVALLAVVFCISSDAWTDTGADKNGLRVDQCPTPSDGAKDDSPRQTREAGASYDLGLVLYEEGDYQGAVDAFVASYCAKAHPAAFYNIAQSYERLLDFELSVRYFERYVAEAGPRAANRKRAALRAEVLRKLPAQVRVATVPAGATITIRNQTGITARGTANEELPLEVTQGEYTMHVEMPGYDSIQQPLITKPGQPYSYYLRLTAKKGRLEVTASPANGRIFLGDRLVGVGTYAESLPVGRYEVTVEAPDRQPSTQVVELTAGGRSKANIALAHPPTSGFRTLLVASGVGLGLTGGAAVSGIFGQDNTITAVGSLATMGLGMGGAYYGIPRSTTRGDAWFIIGSSLLGLTEGALIGAYFACDVTSSSTSLRDEDCNSEAITGAALAGGLAGAAAASLSYESLEFKSADAALLGSGAFWGLGAGATLHAIFDSDLRVRDTMLFTGLNLGVLAAGGLLANDEVSLARVAIIDLAGVGGVLGGVSLAQALDSEAERLQHFSLFGMVAGLATGTFLTRYMDEEKTTPDELKPVVSTTQDRGGHTVFHYGLGGDF